MEQNRNAVRKALADVLRGEGASVVFEEKRSGKFVQFAGSPEDGLQLDLPAQTLDRAEEKRAEAYFLKHHVRLVEYDLLDRPGGQAVGRQRTFQMRFGREVEAATQVVLEVFEQVYRFPPDCELVITVN